MNKARRQYWLKYLRRLADLMELRDWSICVLETQASNGRLAEVQGTYGRKTLTLKFGVDFEKESLEIDRHTCVHELVHGHFIVHDQNLFDARNRYNKNWLHTLGDDLETQKEYMVDAMADIIAPFMPLPPTEKPKKKRKKKAEATS